MRVYFKDLSTTNGYLRILIDGMDDGVRVRKVLEVPTSEAFVRPPPIQVSDLGPTDALDTEDLDSDKIASAR